MRSLLVGLLMLLGVTSVYSVPAPFAGNVCLKTISSPSLYSEDHPYFYDLYLNGVPQHREQEGTGGEISWNLSVPGTYRIKNITSDSWVSAVFNLPEAKVSTSACAGGQNSVLVLFANSLYTYKLIGSVSGVVGTQTGNDNVITFSFPSVGVETFHVLINESCDVINLTGSSIGVPSPTAPPYVIDLCVPGLKLSGITGYSYVVSINDVVVGSGTSTGGLVPVRASGPGNYKLFTTSDKGCQTITNLGQLNIDGSLAPVIYDVSLSQGVNYSCDVALTKKIKLSGSNTGVTYQLQNKGLALQSPLAGTGTALEWTVQGSGGDRFTVVATKTSSSCTAVMNGAVDITYVAPPAVPQMTGDVCLRTIDVPCVQPNTSYQLYLNGNPVAQSPMTVPNPACTNDLRWTNLAPGNYTVKATNNTNTQCSSWTNGAFTIPVNSVPSPYTLSGGGVGCATSTFTVQLSGSQTGVNYTLVDNMGNSEPPVAGTNSGLTWTFSNQTATRVFTVVAMNATTQCTQTMNGSATITYNGPAPYNIAPDLCGTQLAIVLSCSESGVSYELIDQGNVIGNTVQAGTGSCSTPLKWAVPGGGTFQVKATRGACSWISQPAYIPQNASPILPFNVDYGPICQDQSRNIVIMNPQNLVEYRLLDHNSNVYGYGPTVNVTLEEGSSSEHFRVQAVHSVTGCSFTTPPFMVAVYHPVISGGGTSCSPTTISVNSAGLVSYQWYSDGSPQSNGNSTSLNINNVGSHLYKVVVSQGSTMSCSAQVTVDVGFVSTPTISAASATTFCDGGSVKLTANDGESWQWKKNNIDIPGATLKDYTAAQTGKYSCLIKRYSCAVLSDSISVNVLPAPTPVVTGSTSACATTGVTLTASGGVSYQWFFNRTAVGTSASQNFTSSGSVTVKVTGTNGCTKTTSPINVIVNPVPPKPVPVVVGSTTFCQGSFSSLRVPSNGSTYYWYRNGAFWANGDILTVTNDGSYTVKEQTAAGCTSVESNPTVFTVNPVPATTISPASAISFCSNESATLTANPSSGVTYQWFRNGASAGTSQTLSINMAGSYTVTATYPTGCAKTSSATVASIIAIPATPTITQTMSCSGGMVTLTGNVTGSAYLWSSGATTSSITVSTPGTYTLKVRNAGGCWSGAGSTTVSSVSAPNFALTTTGDLCVDGEVTINVVSVVGTVQSRSWSPVVGTGASVQVYSQGTYTCTITFVGGCQITKSVLVKRVPANCQIPLMAAPEHEVFETSFYPNPADHEINVVTPSSSIDRRISLISMQGVEVQTFIIPAETTRKNLPLGALAPGMYFIQIQSPNNLERLKVIVNQKH